MAPTPLTPAEIEEEAHALYDECQTVKQDWDQIGEITKGQWFLKVLAGQRSEKLRLW